MRWTGGRVCIAVVAALMSMPAAAAQEQPGSTRAPQNDFFSGFVVSFSETVITVDRKGLGKDTAATRSFTIDAGTKVEGVLKTKAHVTVRFAAEETGMRAVRIIVR